MTFLRLVSKDLRSVSSKFSSSRIRVLERSIDEFEFSLITAILKKIYMYIIKAVETIRNDIIRSLELKINVKLEMIEPNVKYIAHH